MDAVQRPTLTSAGGDWVIANGGVFIGLASGPVGDVATYPRQIQQLFEAYRTSLRKNETEVKKGWYEPRIYWCLGRWDLVAIALIDDIEMGVRTFKPLDPLLDKPEECRNPFHHQVILGPVPVLGSPGELFDIDELYNEFLEGGGDPLIALCQLKLNPFVCSGAGLSLAFAAIEGIRLALAPKESRTRFLIQTSYGWNELTLLVSGRSYRDLVRAVVRIREWSLNDLARLLESRSSRLSRDWFLEALRPPSLTKLACGLTADGEFDQFRGTHVFVNSTTRLGFDPERVAEVDETDSITAVTRWTTRSGHLKEAKDCVQSASAGAAQLVSVGRSDILELHGRQPTQTVLARVKSLAEKNFLEGLAKHVIFGDTQIATNEADVPMENMGDPATHPDMSGIISSLLVSPQEVGDFNQVAKNKLALKPTAQRFINLLANCNDGIADSMSFSLYLQLLPFVRSTCEKARKSRVPRKKFNLWLQRAGGALDLAERCRHRSGYRMADMTDSGVDVKGGVQVAVSAVDVAFKALVGRTDVFATLWPKAQIMARDCSTLCIDAELLLRAENAATTLGHEAGHLLYDVFAKENEQPDEDRLSQYLLGLPQGATTSGRRSFWAIADEVFSDIVNYWWVFGGDRRLFEESMHDQWQRVQGDDPVEMEVREALVTLYDDNRGRARLSPSSSLRSLPDRTRSAFLCFTDVSIVRILAFVEASHRWARSRLRRVWGLAEADTVAVEDWGDRALDELSRTSSLRRKADCEAFKRGQLIRLDYDPDKPWEDAWARHVIRVLGGFQEVFDQLRKDGSVRPHERGGSFISGPKRASYYRYSGVFFLSLYDLSLRAVHQLAVEQLGRRNGSAAAGRITDHGHRGPRMVPPTGRRRQSHEEDDQFE